MPIWMTPPFFPLSMLPRPSLADREVCGSPMPVATAPAPTKRSLTFALAALTLASMMPLNAQAQDCTNCAIQHYHAIFSSHEVPDAFPGSTPAMTSTGVDWKKGNWVEGRICVTVESSFPDGVRAGESTDDGKQVAKITVRSQKTEVAEDRIGFNATISDWKSAGRDVVLTSQSIVNNPAINDQEAYAQFGGGGVEGYFFVEGSRLSQVRVSTPDFVFPRRDIGFGGCL